jgi:hypothetical protein
VYDQPRSRIPTSRLVSLADSRLGTAASVNSSYHEPLFTTDEDYLGDIEDRVNDRESHTRLWMLFKNPSLSQDLSAEERAKHTSKFPRCQRIVAKWEEIVNEIERNKNKHLEEVCGFVPLTPVSLSEKELQSLDERIEEKINRDLRMVRKNSLGRVSNM